MGFIGNIKTYLRVRDRWEDICEQCGLCCYERVVYDDGHTEIDLSAPCEYLDAETGRCTVYRSRLRTCEDCHKVTLRVAMSKEFLPPSCAYRRMFQGEDG